MQKEIWKDVPNYEGIYQVSNLGNVKSLPREWFSGVNTIRKHNGKILKPGIASGGYFYVLLFKDCKGKVYKIHQLVAMAFLNHKTDGTTKLVIDHIDNNQKNNCLDNLQIITHRENCSKDKVNGKSKYVGVCWHKTANKWVAYIKKNNKRIHLGLFKCELAAHLAYQNKLKQII
jgi:hypothetical protein